MRPVSSWLVLVSKPPVLLLRLLVWKRKQLGQLNVLLSNAPNFLLWLHRPLLLARVLSRCLWKRVVLRACWKVFARSSLQPVTVKHKLRRWKRRHVRVPVMRNMMLNSPVLLSKSCGSNLKCCALMLLRRIRLLRLRGVQRLVLRRRRQQAVLVLMLLPQICVLLKRS